MSVPTRIHVVFGHFRRRHFGPFSGPSCGNLHIWIVLSWHNIIISVFLCLLFAESMRRQGNGRRFSFPLHQRHLVWNFDLLQEGEEGAAAAPVSYRVVPVSPCLLFLKTKNPWLSSYNLNSFEFCKQLRRLTWMRLNSSDALVKMWCSACFDLNDLCRQCSSVGGATKILSFWFVLPKYFLAPFCQTLPLRSVLFPFIISGQFLWKGFFFFFFLAFVPLCFCYRSSLLEEDDHKILLLAIIIFWFHFLVAWLQFTTCTWHSNVVSFLKMCFDGPSESCCCLQGNSLWLRKEQHAEECVL